MDFNTKSTLLNKITDYLFYTHRKENTCKVNNLLIKNSGSKDTYITHQGKDIKYRELDKYSCPTAKLKYVPLKPEWLPELEEILKEKDKLIKDISYINTYLRSAFNISSSIQDMYDLLHPLLHPTLPTHYSTLVTNKIIKKEILQQFKKDFPEAKDIIVKRIFIKKMLGEKDGIP